MPKQTLELVETLRRENEILRKEIEILSQKYEMAVSEREANVKGFTEEIANKNAEIEYLKSQLDDRCERCIAGERAEARKEFAEMLKKTYPFREPLHRTLDDLMLDELLRKMESESNVQTPSKS